MAGLKRVIDAIRKENNAADRCACGHKKRMHVWPGGMSICKVAHCHCHTYVEASSVEEEK